MLLKVMISSIKLLDFNFCSNKLHTQCTFLCDSNAVFRHFHSKYPKTNRKFLNQDQSYIVYNRKIIQLKVNNRSEGDKLIRFQGGHEHDLLEFDVFEHPDIQFTLVMRRYPLFYNVFLITPCLLISFLTALVYYLPCSSHQKITFCTSVLLGMKKS